MKIKNIFLRSILRQVKPPRLSPVSVVVLREYNSRNGSSQEKYWRYGKAAVAISLGSVLVGGAIRSTIENNQPVKQVLLLKSEKPDQHDESEKGGAKIPGLPTYTADEVSQHNTIDNFWVTYKHGVYDVTSFLTSHPGGDQILNAAGLSIEPFWNVYGMHKTPEIFKLLESYRIGNLHDDDIVDHSDDELWVKEPLRDKRLVVKTAKPFNAEIPPQYQVAHFDTPNELFYVRQHMPVPELDPETHKLKVTVVSDDGSVKTTSFTLQELNEKFKRVNVRAALMCAGNRRSEMDKQVRPVKGISWSTGAISNAEWSGVLLRDVLLHCGVDEEHLDGKHVIMSGADTDATGVQFSTSVPLPLVMCRSTRALLATHMNRAPLPPDHGRPLRGIVPGAPAVRSVKWLESITVSRAESESHWHQKDYRSFNSSTTWETADFANAPPLYSLPVTSAVCDPVDGARVKVRDGYVTARGYAYSGGGARIVRVDVSVDGGRSWRAAELQRDAAPPPAHHAWALWTVRLPATAHQMEIWVKATDSNFNTQPEKFDDIWNIRGLLSNAYHKIKIDLQY